MFGFVDKKQNVIFIPTVKTADAARYVAFPSKARVTAVKVVADATLAAHDTNYCTLTVKDVGADGTGTSTICTITNKSTGGAGAWTAKYPVSGTIVTAADADIVAAGNVVEIAAAETGTLGADPNVAVTIEYVCE